MRRSRDASFVRGVSGSSHLLLTFRATFPHPILPWQRHTTQRSTCGSVPSASRDFPFVSAVESSDRADRCVCVPAASREMELLRQAQRARACFVHRLSATLPGSSRGAGGISNPVYEDEPEPDSATSADAAEVEVPEANRPPEDPLRSGSGLLQIVETCDERV
ncbi:uncharacterized protein LOC133472199 isoform X3 [Phyllopteryx taeniolatus]|uniref:uncharacterized protein LOC133472199 isoform X3 n=1 Tax=Phyllopteryx taeniolatus TaxID=161469 RepID=UPI002AD3DE75|nr:uncharacterized protein LOC133472199 isoform X3 [Phyllopteryx taeniolatus]